MHSVEPLKSSGPAHFTGDLYLIEEAIMRSILLWMLGVPIPIIILIALVSH